ncbi:MAG: hypothetical protein HY776_02280 [Actinobacteria bacterium]|nr:hypothetical protein [Actinomycetota bacterium]
MADFDNLKQLQELDLIIDGLRREKVNLPEKDKLDSLCKELDRLTNYLSKKEEEFHKVEMKQKKLEGEIDTITNKVKSEEKRLYSGVISNSKELGAIQKEIESLNNKKDETETELIEHLDLVDNLKGVLVKLNNQKEEFLIAKDKLEKKTNSTISDIDIKLDELCKQREETASLTDNDLLTLYEETRAEKDGLAVVELKDGICQGCGMELSAEEADKMSHSETQILWRCEHCRRIFLR